MRKVTGTSGVTLCLVVLIVLPVVQLLSVPVAIRAARLQLHPLEVCRRSDSPVWLKRYCTPYRWAMLHTPLWGPLNRYAERFDLKLPNLPTPGPFQSFP